jgi:hypothetical protein
LRAWLAVALLVGAAAALSVIRERTSLSSPAHATFVATTSSTLPADERICLVTFRLLSEVTLGSIQFESRYGRNVRYVGEGTDVECEPVAGRFWVVSDSGETIERNTKIRAAMIDDSGVQGPADLLRCRVRYADTPASADDIWPPKIEDATGPDAVLLDPLPELGLRFTCPGVTTTTTGDSTTTTSTTTTTTWPDSPRCGRPVQGCGRYPSATDALAILFAAVGAGPVDCPACRCDLDGSGGVSATDALAALQRAVRIEAPLLCPVGSECDGDVPPPPCSN